MFGLALGWQPAFATGPLVWVVPSTLERVYRTQPAGRRTTTKIFAARGEYQSFQIAIQAPAGGLSNVNFSVSDLAAAKEGGGSSDLNTMPAGARIPRLNLTLYREKYMSVLEHSPTYNGPPNLPITNIDTFPDALIPFIDPATGQPPAAATYKAVPFNLTAGHNAVIWADVYVPRGAVAREYHGTYTVTSNQGTFQGRIHLHVWDFSLPLKPSLKSSFNGGGTTVPGVNEEMLRNRIMPDTVDPAAEREFIDHYGLNATDLGFFDGVSYGQCEPSEPPSVQEIESAKAMQQPDLYLYDDSADPESSCTSAGFYSSVTHWAQNLHRAGIENLVTQEPVPQLYSDGLGTGRSAVDIWTMLPLAYDNAQSYTPPRVTYILKKGDSAWSYNALVQDAYSPKWEIDFLPINYRIQPGFISQSLGLTGILYWSVDDWSLDPWNDPQGNQDPDYPGEGILVYPGAPAGLQGVAPSMRLKYLRDGVQDYEYIQILKKCGQEQWALDEARRVGADWSHWTTDEELLEMVRRQLGDKIAALHCAP
jgi:hypothetical protein